MSDETNQRRVHPAEAWRQGAMGSFGKAATMLLQQFNFPDTYDERDIVTCAYSDRCRSWDWDHFQQALERAGIRGDQGIPHWVEDTGQNQVMTFLKDILKVEEHHPGVEWTGFRVCGSVSPASGYSVCLLDLFAKHKDSKTKTYTTRARSMFFGEKALPPNVHMAPKEKLASEKALQKWGRGGG